MTKYLTRKEASAYLMERGIHITPRTLQKYAVVGGGPKYTKFGNKALMAPEWLDEWVEERLPEPRRTTSEAQAA